MECLFESLVAPRCCKKLLLQHDINRCFIICLPLLSLSDCLPLLSLSIKLVCVLHHVLCPEIPFRIELCQVHNTNFINMKRKLDMSGLYHTCNVHMTASSSCMWQRYHSVMYMICQVYASYVTCIWKLYDSNIYEIWAYINAKMQDICIYIT